MSFYLNKISDVWERHVGKSSTYIDKKVFENNRFHAALFDVFGLQFVVQQTFADGFLTIERSFMSQRNSCHITMLVMI